MRFFGLATCDTCRRALKDLRAAGLDPQVIDLRRDAIAPDDRAAILAAHGDAAINRRSTTWRGLSDADRAAPADSLLARHPTLLKRPAIDDGGRWYLGWGPAQRAALVPPRS